MVSKKPELDPKVQLRITERKVGGTNETVLVAELYLDGECRGALATLDRRMVTGPTDPIYVGWADAVVAAFNAMVERGTGVKNFLNEKESGPFGKEKG